MFNSCSFCLLSDLSVTLQVPVYVRAGAILAKKMRQRSTRRTAGWVSADVTRLSDWEAEAKLFDDGG